MGADSLTTQAALDAETTLRTQGDERLANFIGKGLASGIPDANLPNYSQYGTLSALADNDVLTLSLWKLDSQKQGKMAIQDDGTQIVSNPTFLNFVDAANDGFNVTANGLGANIRLDALGKWWSGDTPETISASGTGVDSFTNDRFATGINVTKSVIGHISAAWTVVSAVSLQGRRVKSGAN